MIPEHWKRGEWYVACVDRRRLPHEQAPELRAEALARALGVPALAPVGAKVLRRRARKVAAPRCAGERALLYPGYLLVGVLPGSPRLSAMRQVDKVTGFLGHEGVPCRLRPGEFAALADALNLGRFAGEGGPKRGTLVDILDGPFRDHRASVVDSRSDKGVITGACVEVAMLGRVVPVMLPLDSLRLVAA